ncbi:ABC transporter ATP-binding protein [Desulforhabdus sp. TSK]|uniref:ABC transporter ATP-binding protein n=1 Tax=Desulforhabdus sp. TSK TaxID=2925014 RepID=UPI001FC80672|nr:ABC transporter ATP-binding protein [Desulforhabdus sp. TSK]GKT10795.1 ABC transporter permease [Desulforhabdus sp. TSK]
MRREIFKYLRPYRVPFALALLQVFLISAFEILKPWPMKIVIDNVLTGKPVSWTLVSSFSQDSILLLSCAGLVLIYLFLGGMTIVNNYTTIRIGQRMVNDFRSDLYSHLQRLSLAFHSRRQVGDLLYRITADTFSIQALTMNGVFPIVTATALLGMMFFVMIRLDWQLTILALSICPALILTISLMSRKIVVAATHYRERESEVYSVVQRAMSAIRIIQAFTKEEEEHRKFMRASTESLGASLRMFTLQTIYSGVVDGVMAVGTACVIWIGAKHVLEGSLSVGDIVVFTSYLASLYAPINTISQTWGVIQTAKVGVQRVLEILNVERDMKDGSRVFPGEGAKGEILLENVSFSYVQDQPVLKNISVHVQSGQTVAIVGPTGVGKSTLVSLVPRFYDPVEGRVLLDGVDVREYQLKSLRHQISMVLQPPLVFPISIKENIAYGRPEASDEQIIEAARLARIHDSVMRLPKGYDTPVGEQGTTLSEGERQRVTIARAILRDAPILILDEPTSSVDAETEAAIMDGLNQLMVGRTTFIIAHRLSTVRAADKILVLRAGEVVEQGSFEDLVRAGGFFASLYRTQFGLVE